MVVALVSAPEESYPTLMAPLLPGLALALLVQLLVAGILRPRQQLATLLVAVVRQSVGFCPDWTCTTLLSPAAAE